MHLGHVVVKGRSATGSRHYRIIEIARPCAHQGDPTFAALSFKPGEPHPALNWYPDISDGPRSRPMELFCHTGSLGPLECLKLVREVDTRAEYYVQLIRPAQQHRRPISTDDTDELAKSFNRHFIDLWSERRDIPDARLEKLFGSH